MPQLKEQVSLKPYNTFGIEASAKWWVEVKSIADATEFVVDNLHSDQPLWILGGGSNLLLTGDFEGLILKNAITGLEIVEKNDQHIWVKVGAGENWHKLVMHAVEHSWGGIENLALIPGSVGASPIQNIGAYGVELKDVFHSLDAIHLKTGNSRSFFKEECDFGYRDSIFKNQAKGKYLITSVTLKLNLNHHQLNTTYAPLARVFEESGKNPTIKSIAEAVIAIRSSKLPDPQEIGNSGSFFKNPVISHDQFVEVQEMYEDVPHYPASNGRVKLPAAWLIQQCGWKGQRFGNYGVHDRQALVLVNYGGASGQDIFNLSERIMDSVKLHFGISLEREVNVL
jgi:UDP-N-acetylmuramate dehydrogenase